MKIVIAHYVSIFIFMICTNSFPNTNLICNGGFQQYKLNPCAPGEKCMYIASDFSCWYDRRNGVVEIKRRVTPWTTNYCQLVHSQPYTLCQNISLQVGKLYQLKFTVFNPETTEFSTIIVLLSNKSLLNFTTLNPLNISHASQKFLASSATSQICFSPLYQIGIDHLYSGPGLDNVSVVKLSPEKDYYDIFCTTDIDFEKEEVIISCQIQNSETEYYLKLLSKSLQCFINDQKQDQCSVKNLNSTVLGLSITPTNDSGLKNVAIQIGKQTEIDVPVPQFTFHVTGLSIMMMKLKEKEHRLLKNVESVSSFIMSSTEKAYFVLKNCVASYFLISIINFWNLSLMYNVLNISTIPSFSKYFLQKLTFLFFNLNSLTEWAKENIPSLKQTLDFSEIDGRQFMEETKNSFPWFGKFGISSNFVQNNFETFFLMFLMGIKLSLILLLRKIPFFKKLIPHKTKLLKVFLCQLISLQTFMIMSATEAIKNLNYVERKQKINNSLHVVNVWVFFVVVVLYFIVSINLGQKKKFQQSPQREEKDCQNKKQEEKIAPKSKNEIKKQRKKPKNLSLNRKKLMITEFSNLFEFILIIIIPSLVLLNNPPIFLIVTSMVFLYRIYWFCYNFKNFTIEIDEKIFNGLNILCWTILQLSYISLWVFEKILQQNPYLDELSVQDIYYCIKLIGFIIVLTILLGGVFQILKFFVETLKLVFGLTKILLIKYKTSILPLPHKIQKPETKKEENKKYLVIQSIKNSLNLQPDHPQTLEKARIEQNSTRITKITILTSKKRLNIKKAQRANQENKKKVNFLVPP